MRDKSFMWSVNVFMALTCGCTSPDSDVSSLRDLYIQPLSVPCLAGGQPNLSAGPEGTYLSWVEYLNDSTDALTIARYGPDGWSHATEIARGGDWFVNWADFPSLMPFPGGDALAAHWLQMRSTGTYDYDVHIATSNDRGETWAPSFIPHRDSIAAEHGFVSMVGLESGHILGVWLDGRKMPVEGDAGHDNHGHGHGGGPMTIRCAEFDVEGNLSAEAELDDRVCECCQTDAALTNNGPVVVYRDRTENEVRDISIVRRVNGQWTSPRAVFEDNWDIAGCPVNGPSVAARGDRVAITWFTAAGGKAAVKVVFSSDNGATLTEPLVVDDGMPVGRVDIEWISDKEVLVVWLENVEQVGHIRARTVHVSGQQSASTTLVETSVSRRSGFPVLALHDSKLLLAWTDVSEEDAIVRSAMIMGSSANSND